MINKDDIKEFNDVCMGLTKANLKYALAVINALKFTEDNYKRNTKLEANKN